MPFNQKIKSYKIYNPIIGEFVIYGWQRKKRYSEHAKARGYHFPPPSTGYFVTF
jgi:hypothetical protein